MSTRESDREYRIAQTAIATVYVLLISVLAIASASAEDDAGIRASSSKHFVEGGRDSERPDSEVRDVFQTLETNGSRQAPGRTAIAADTDTPRLARATSNDFWIYEADVVLFGDDDNDGYFYGIDLLIDADTVWSAATVYAVTYLSLDGGPWNEYAVTGDFTIEGAYSDDEYVLVTELESGYPTGDYDILIELYDSRSGEFLTDLGPEASADLGFLPLEDFNRDAPRFDRPVTVSHGHGGGSAGLLMLVVLGGAGFGRMVLRRQTA